MLLCTKEMRGSRRFKITSLNGKLGGGVTIYHNIANGDTTFGDSGGDHLHERALAQMNVHVCGSGDSNGVHDCVVCSVWGRVE